jgi:phosphoribosyl 1,2-cyclic phosphodiesterase
MSFRFRVLGSGSTGNTTLVEAGSTRLLLDAGLGPREMAERLQSLDVDPASIAAVFLSHEHGDHARGAASFSRRWGVRLCGTRGTYAAAGLGAEEIAGYDVLEPGAPVRLDGVAVTGIPVPHDAAAPVAFVVAYAERAFGHATDLGHINRGLVRSLLECDAVLIESNYDPGLLRAGPYPWSLKERILGGYGHLSNEDVARFLGHGLGEACRRVVLAHVSQTNNDPELVLMAAESALRRRGRSEVKLDVAGVEGSDWVELMPAQEPSLRRPKQMRMF